MIRNRNVNPRDIPPVDDPVYKFLINVREGVEKVACELYDENHDGAEDYFEGDKRDTDKEVFVEGKIDSLDSMIGYFGTRGRMKRDNEKDGSLRIDTEEKYNYLLGFVGKNDLFNQETLKRFVDELPSYSWEKFCWSVPETVG